MANFNYNKTFLGGRLTSDPERKTTPSGISVARFTIAVNRRTARDEERKTDFINCVAFRGTADFVCGYFHKADSIFVSGTLQTDKWTDRDGGRHEKVEVVVDEANFVDGKNDKKDEPHFEDVTDAPSFDAISDDESLPF